ncbi:MAG TPA: HAD hydrolase-like protein [Streptosporangiaceae bacterium]|nr:HAD hydrolase-like protein [Streptosporangiaceae bacterium]
MSSFLVLWDVDFTLVNTRGVGIHLYQLAFRDLYGRDLPPEGEKADMAGRTDRAIVLDVLATAGVPDPPGEVSRFEAALARLAPAVEDMVKAKGRVMPGASAALGALTSRSAFQSVLTGNVRAMAEVKLAPFGLLKYLDLDIGAYGDESAVRADLVHLARGRATSTHWKSFHGQATILVGDTPLDIEAARATGARSVGVATGRFSEAELIAAGADAVLADLTDTEAVVNAVVTP